MVTMSVEDVQLECAWWQSLPDGLMMELDEGASMGQLALSSTRTSRSRTPLFFILLAVTDLLASPLRWIISTFQSTHTISRRAPVESIAVHRIRPKIIPPVARKQIRSFALRRHSGHLQSILRYQRHG